jgi:hypothetical protein
VNALQAANQVAIAPPLLVRQGSCRRSAWAFFLTAAVWFPILAVVAGDALAAMDVKVAFTLNNTDGDGGPLRS